MRWSPEILLVGAAVAADFALAAYAKHPVVSYILVSVAAMMARQSGLEFAIARRGKQP